tara:strand:- start:6442 stop:7380 length:939 start_codon:yes stop_codon:yes gene_type:complete
MNVQKYQDESSDFVCESEDTNEVEVESQEVEVNEEQASSETNNTEDDASEDEASAESDNESTDKEEADSSGDNTTADSDKPKKRDGYQKSIDRVTRQREDEKRKNESLELRIKELEGKNKPQDKGENKEPVEDDFETYDKYLDALDKFDKQEDHSDKSTTNDNKDTESKVDDELTSSQKTALAITQERVSSADKPDDFDAIALNPELPVTGEMLEALSECDDPAKVMYHLGQNKDLAAQIAGKTPAQQMREIAKLDLTITSKPKKPTKITNAPDAISPVSGTDSQQKAESEMSFAEFEAHDRARNSQRKSTW